MLASQKKTTGLGFITARMLKELPKRKTCKHNVYIQRNTTRILV
jgi:hypothetical protein